MKQEPQGSQEFEASLVARRTAKRAKLLQDVRIKIHWFEWFYMAVGLAWLGWSFRSWDSLERPVREAMTPISQLIMAVLWMLMTFIMALSRRINGLTELFDDPEVKGSCR